MFVFDTVAGRVRIAFTGRYDAGAAEAGAELDLADGDTALRRVVAALGAGSDDPVLMRQVHGRTVAVVDGGVRRQPVVEADAMVTGTPGPVLVARAADCVPIALADPARGLAGVVHSGRGGTVAGVVPATVEMMRSLGAADVVAWLGPRICGACYEVPSAMRDEVAAVEPETWATTRRGTPGLDLGAGVAAQLRRAGVEVHDLAADSRVCTMESEALFSHRRQGGAAGRQGVLVRVLG